jgi:divalent metal cation (Fe/Co/Zn/Cd) transporter
MLRRRSRTDRLAEEVKDASPVARAAVIAVAAAGVLALAYVARRRLFQALAVVADAVEEVADTVEDAAEDVRDFARARAEAG